MSIALGVRSDFSLGESVLSVSEIPEIAKQKGYSSVAVTDTMTISSMIELAKAAKKAVIKPIIGCRIRVVDDPLDKTPPKKRTTPNREFFVKVFVKNEDGLKALFKLLSLANDDDHFYSVPRVGFDELVKALRSDGLIFSGGDFQSILTHPRYAEYYERIASAHSSSQTFVELCPINTPLFDTLNEIAIEQARNNGFTVMLSRPILYKDSDMTGALDTLSVITSKATMNSPWRPKQYVQDFTFISEVELLGHAKAAKERIENRRGKGWCEHYWAKAFRNNQLIENQCKYVWKKSEIALPKMADDEYAELVKKIRAGWEEKLRNPVLGFMPEESDLLMYKRRLATELKVLRDMKFENYFLLVEQLVSWCRDQGIIVGPGRGSVGGSLIAYLLSITDVDPIRFSLFFERFINPERLDLPDIDLDFMSSRRHEVIEHLADEYGKENVAGISNYGKLGTASSLRDISRVNGLMPYEYSCTKLVPSTHGQSHGLEESAEEVAEIEKFKAEQPEIWNTAIQLHGKMRSLGKHAAGIVVAGIPIIERGVVERRKGEPTVNWDKRTVEEQGLIKMDILGLSTLDVLDVARKKIKARHKIDVDFKMLPLDDQKVLDAFGEGKSVGVFQFESPGMRGLLKSLAPLTFNDIAAATALYRPGPMDSGLMDDYVQVKQGNKATYYEHPNMEDSLKTTLGVIVYQEQVMQLARDLAGFTMAGADHLRKAMGKKDKDMMAKQRQKWIDGCLDHSGMDARSSGILFDKIESFAGYAFNRSHAVEYSIISYWAMYCKVYYPLEFYAATLSILKEEQLGGIVADAEAHDIKVYPPDINVSTQTFEIGYDVHTEKHVLVAPFNRVKGVSTNIGGAILEAREKVGEFTDYSSFFDAIEKRKCNRGAQGKMDKVGVFSTLKISQRDLDRHAKDFPYIELDQLPARHPDRLKDQIELLPELVTTLVKADRKISVDKFAKAKVINLVNEYRDECEKCSLSGGVHPSPQMGSSPQIMIVTDCPTWQEDKAGQLFDKKSGNYLRVAMSEAGIKANSIYYTTLVKSIKEGKLTNDQINSCSGYLKQEIEILRPPIIVALGSVTARHLVSGLKGGYEEICGQVHFSKDLDASVVIGLNPQIIYHNPDKQEMLNEVFKKVSEMMY